MSRGHKVLLVDDESGVRSLLRSRLERRGYEIAEAGDGEAALELVKSFAPNVVVTDLRMPGKDGFYLLSKSGVPTIIITGHGDKASAIRAVEGGAFAFFEKPFDLDALEVAVQRAAERHLLELERQQLTAKLDRLCKLQDRELESHESRESSPFLGKCAPIEEIRDTLSRLARKTQANVLILGETGTGKEVVARELHRLTHSKESRSPFLALNCAAIPSELLESELFGHEKGSFTGAHAQRIGLAEAVREGTLFLDEIGEMDLKLQSKLLRLIQERAFKRVGSNNEAPFQGRVVAATHRNLQERIRLGTFREDLYYRLAVVSVTLPALRERGEDFDLIASSLCKAHGLKGLRSDVRARSQTYRWPGNIRELHNWIERAAILGEHDEQGLVNSTPPGVLAALNTNAQETAAASNSPDYQALMGRNFPASDIKTLRNRLLEEADRQWIIQALDRFEGNISAAARALGLDRKNLAKRMKALNIPLAREKRAA